MASLYKNKNIWYLSVSIGKDRTTRSLRTSDYTVAKKLKPYIESQLILELTGLKKRTAALSFPDLAAKFLQAKSHRSDNTQMLYEYVFRSYLNDKTLPSNPNSRAIFIRTVNACWNWGLKQGLIDKANKLTYDTRGEPRQRVYTSDELKLIFDEINDEDEVIVNYCDFGTYWDYNDFLKHTRDRDADGAVVAYKGFHPHMIKSPNYAFIKDKNQSYED